MLGILWSILNEHIFFENERYCIFKIKEKNFLFLYQITGRDTFRSSPKTKFLFSLTEILDPSTVKQYSSERRGKSPTFIAFMDKKRVKGVFRNLFGNLTKYFKPCNYRIARIAISKNFEMHRCFCILSLQTFSLLEPYENKPIC